MDLPALGAALWRKKWRILGPTILAALLALVVCQMITPRYLSESRVLIEGRDNIYLRPDADKDLNDRNNVDDEAVTSQAQIIMSRDLALEVIKELKLNQRPEFDPTLAGTSKLHAILALLGIVRNPATMSPEERVLEAYYDRLTVSPVDKSQVIVIDFRSQDPELAARVANTIADAYLQRQRQTKQDQARTAADYLSGEIDSMRKKVADAESKVEAFRAKSNLLEGPNDTTLSAQQLGDINAQLAAARAQQADADAKAKMIRQMLNSGKPIDSSDILNSELIRRLSEQRVTLRAQLAQQSTTLLDQHPRIKELKAQIADLDQQIRAEAESAARSLENDAQVAGARFDSLQASLDQLKNQAASTNEQDVELRALQRDAKSQRDLLESYLAKYREATARDTINSSPADARVISQATVSSVPAYPKKLPTVLIAALTTLVLGSGFVLTRELLGSPAQAVPVQRTRPARPAPPEPLEEEPAVAESLASRVASFVRPSRQKEPAPADGARSRPAHPVAIPINAIADVAYSLHRAGDRRIAVLGAAPGLSSGAAAVALARALAETARVVLVGLDPGNDDVKAISNDPSAAGLAELAAGTASFRDIITRDRQSTLQLISSGFAPADRVALLSAPGMAMSFDALARAYDFVVVDAGTVAGPELEAIGEIAPHGVLIADALASPATLGAHDRLLSAGFDDVTLLVGGRPGAAAASAAAA